MSTLCRRLFFLDISHRLRQGLPFDVKIPNKTTRETFKKTNEGKELIKCKDADDMFKKLGI